MLHNCKLKSKILEIFTVDNIFKMDNYWRVTSSRQLPLLDSSLLSHFSYVSLCVDKLTSQCTGKEWSLARISRIPVIYNAYLHQIPRKHWAACGHHWMHTLWRNTFGCVLDICLVLVLHRHSVFYLRTVSDWPHLLYWGMTPH